MKPHLVQDLVCPESGRPLELLEIEGRDYTPTPEERALAERAGLELGETVHEVTTGVLVEREGRRVYPIVRGVPRMLRFATAVSAEFEAAHGAWLARELPGFRLPDGTAMPGEEDVLRTFSREWLDYDWDGRTYWNQPADAWFRSMSHVLELEPDGLRGKKLCEVGIGIGGVADFVSRHQHAPVYGMDLGYAVDAAWKHFWRNPLFHAVQASIFHPPFAGETFDFVYSFGVIHHTFSTATAFESIRRLPTRGGRLYVWVYSPNNESRTPVRRALMKIETVVRPVVTRLPDWAQAVALAPTVPVYMGHQLVQSLRGEGQLRYGLREAMHAARDRLTPRFAHRHSEDELAGWFEAAGYEDLHRASGMARPSWLPIGFVANAAVSGRRAGPAS
jgi:SAM-dependent methyltransferase/uncharacterized protein YbaR (Trm112 family)